MKIDRELMRGAGPLAVLQILERGEMYGYQLVEALSSLPNGALSMGQSTVYPMLYNLEAKGLVQARWDEGASGRNRKYYSLTDEGRTYLASQRQQWRSLFGALASLGITGSAES